MTETSTERLVLDGAYPLDQLDQLKTRLSQTIGPGKRVEIDTTSLTQANVALIQLLFSAQISARDRRCELVVGCSEDGVLAEALSTSGFAAARPLAPRLEGGRWSGLVTVDGGL